VAKSYNQYCPVAHALDVIGERWSLLIVRELIEHEQLRYSDLHCRLTGCGTNILAARLKDLERYDVVRRRRLPPPAASTVYELTEYGQELRPVLHVLAHWGARSLGPPGPDEDLESGWLAGALRMAFPPHPTDACIEFRVGGEVAAFVEGESVEGHAESPDAVVECDRAGFFHLVVDQDVDGVTLQGDLSAVHRLVATLRYATGGERTPAGVTAG